MPSQAQRIKGQEVSIQTTVNGERQQSINDIQNLEVEFQLELLREGYLGEKTDRRDEVFRGVRGKMDLHFETSDTFKTIVAIIARAQRREPGNTINVQATLRFPNGENTKVVMPDVFFGPIPMTFGSRTEYGKITLDFEGQDVQVI